MAYVIGSKFIETNWKNWVQGMTTSNNTSDGGFAPGYISTVGASNINPLITPGVLNFPASATDKSTNLSGEIIASCEDPDGASYDKLFVTNSGKFYGWNGSTLSTAIATDGTRAYVYGKTDMAAYGPNAYGTSSTYVWEWVVSTATITQTYFAFPTTSGSATWSAASLPHPVLVYEGNIYYGNGPQLLRQTTVGGVPAEILLLQNYSDFIVALGIDPGTGLMLISTSNGLLGNLSATLPKINKVLYYDGFSNKVRKVIIVDEMVTCFYNMGGTVFVGYGQNFGYWTGTGIQFLRRLNISLSSGELLYKNHITNVGKILYLVEKSRILAFGEIMQGQGRSWWYAYQNAPSGTLTNIGCVSTLGSNKIGFGFPTAKFSTLDLSSSASLDNSSIIYLTNNYFPRPVIFNSIVIDYATAIPINTDIGTVKIFTDDDGVQPTIGTVRTTQENQFSFQITYPSIESRIIQVRYTPAVNSVGINRILVFYNDKQ